VNHAPWTKALAERRVLGVIRVFRALFRIQVVEITEELVKAVIGRQELIRVTQVVFAELATDISMGLE